jgi:hypothetical protein
VRVHEYIELILLRYSQDLDRKCNPLIIIDAWTGMLDGLPRENVSDRIISPFAQAFEVSMGVIKRERAPYEGDIIGLEELVFDIRGNVRVLRVFGIACHVDASQHNLPIIAIPERLPVDMQAQRTHAVRVKSERRRAYSQRGFETTRRCDGMLGNGLNLDLFTELPRLLEQVSTAAHQVSSLSWNRTSKQSARLLDVNQHKATHLQGRHMPSKYLTQLFFSSPISNMCIHEDGKQGSMEKANTRQLVKLGWGR